MKITAVETVRLTEFANIIWVRLHTDEGPVGLGETFMGAAAVEAGHTDAQRHGHHVTAEDKGPTVTNPVLGA